MKSHVVAQEVERSGTQAEGQFTIKATSKAFDILSSGLYSDKIQAIVRELSCNAHDSHVAANKGDVPIELRLPSHMEPTFYVRDYGLGLSHEDVMKLYTTYFESTKTNSDDFIGQLGLGSKSPFSYATNFLVESRFEGTHRIYSCFKNEQNLPAITLMSEQETEEGNGVTVTLAVRRDDVDKFHNAARKALMYFNPKPNVVGRNGFAPYRLVHTVSGTNWRIRDTDYYAGMNGAHVVQGFVAYPVDEHLLSENGISAAASALATTDIDLFVEIGKVEVAASREALSYDKRTILNLIAVFEQAASEMRSSFQAEFDKCTTGWEVAMLLDKLETTGSQKFRTIFKEMNKTDPFKWNGKDVTTSVELDLASTKFTTLSRVTVGGRKQSKLVFHGTWNPTNTTTKFSWNAQNNTFILVDTETKGTNDAIRNWLKTKPEKDGRGASALVIRPISRTQYNQGEIDQIINQLGHPSIVQVKDIPRAAGKSYSKYVKRAAESKLVFTGFTSRINRNGRSEIRRVFSRLCWETKTIDMAAGGFYVNIDRFTAMNGYVPAENLDDVISSAKKLGLISDIDVVGLNEKEVVAAKKLGPWTELFSYLNAEFHKANTNGEMYGCTIVDEVFTAIGASIRTKLVEQWDTVGVNVVDGEFKTIMEKLVTLSKTAGKYATEDVNLFVTHMGIMRSSTNNAAIILPQEWKQATSHYELFAYIAMSEHNSRWVAPLLNYINLVDSK